MAEQGDKSKAIAQAVNAANSASGGNAGTTLFLLVALFLIYLNRIGALSRIMTAIREPVADTVPMKSFGTATGSPPSNTMPPLRTPNTNNGLPGNKPPLSGAITPKGSLGK